MEKILIGYTGFVGGNIKHQTNFTEFYNSKNFKEMRNKKCDFLLCAGLPAAKWLINKNPAQDWENIVELQNILSTIKTKRMVLISTIDVYPKNRGENEDFDCGIMDNHRYGTHRFRFEEFCMKNFSNLNIVRLPALFGRGLKKNIIFDLLNDNCLDAINLKSSFQYYNLDNLWKDIQKIVEYDIKQVNFFTAPIYTKEIVEQFFPSKKIGGNAGEEKHYDLYTKYANLWGKKIPYIQSKEDVMQDLSRFIVNYQKGGK